MTQRFGRIFLFIGVIAVVNLLSWLFNWSFWLY